MRKALLVIFTVLMVACKSTDEPVIQTDTKYYTFDLIKIAAMCSTSYNITSNSLVDYKINEETLIGIRTGEYFLKDGGTLFTLELQESSSNTVKKITIQPSYLKYSDKEQLEMFVKYIQESKTKFTFSFASYETTSMHIISSVDNMVKLLQDNPTLYKNNTFMVSFNNGANTDIMIWYLANQFMITIE